LPEFNLTLIREDNRNIKLSKQAHLEPIIKDPEELTKLSVSLEENLDNKEQSIFRNKYVIYPLGSSTIILASGIGLSIWYIRNKKNNKEPNTNAMQRRCVILVSD